MKLTEEQKADGWIEHDGGPCPVAGDAKVGLMFGPDEIGNIAVFAHGTIAKFHGGEFGANDWEHQGRLEDRIFAYRPEPKQEM